MILESRLAATRTLCQVIDTMDYPPRLLVNASGLGYYGSLPPGQLIDLCFSGRYKKDDLKNAMKGKILGQGELVGTYMRAKKS